MIFIHFIIHGFFVERKNGTVKVYIRITLNEYSVRYENSSKDLREALC